MAGITEKVCALLDEGVDDHDEITERILAGTDPAELVEMFRPLVRWQVSHALRQMARQKEVATFPSVKSGQAPSGTIVDELRNLIATTFVLADGERVTWGEATVEQHERRASMLRLHAERTIDTALRHEKAADMIAEAGATCLADLLDEPHKPPKRRQKAAA